MKKRTIIILGVLFILVIIVITGIINKNQEKETLTPITTTPINKPQITTNTIDYQAYNHQFVDEGNVEQILDNLIGTTGKTAFYLPPSGYINVTRGENFGVAFALNNPEPSGNNYFEYEFKPDASTSTSCGVDEKTAKSWISMGFKSFGKIPQGWIDKMTVYFTFKNVPKPCVATYNFEVVKDGELYARKQLVFNIL